MAGSYSQGVRPDGYGAARTALAKIEAADGDCGGGRIQVGYNGVAVDKRETIARYATVANEIGEYGKTLSQMFTDGRIDDAERAKLAAARIRRAAELNATSNVTVNVDANLPQ